MEEKEKLRKKRSGLNMIQQVCERHSSGKDTVHEWAGWKGRQPKVKRTVVLVGKLTSSRTDLMFFTPKGNGMYQKSEKRMERDGVRGGWKSLWGG